MSSPEEVVVRDSLFSASSASSSTEKKQRQHNVRRSKGDPGGWSSLTSYGDRGRPWRSKFARKPRSARRAIICAPWTCPIAAHHLAALQIQCHVRGFMLRARICSRQRSGDDSSTSLTAGSSATKPRKSKRRSRTGRQLDKYLRRVEKETAREDEPEKIGEGGGGNRERPTGAWGFAEWCSGRIQAWWRMILARFRYRYLRYPVYGLAALQIQYAWKIYQQNTIYDMSTREIKDDRMSSLLDASLDDGGSSRPSRELASLEAKAAKVIQDCWRRRVALSIYRYYRNVIDFRLGGDPRLLLRAINPGEAALFDRAAGVHVRFRLGGFSFPPSIYYKVYTHQPVADIGAFAPRAYVEETKEDPGERWNHPRSRGKGDVPDAGHIRVGCSYFGATVKRTGPKGTKNWYRRHENNGWRPITIKALSSAENDPITVATAAFSKAGDDADGSPGGVFHYSKLVREECRVARIKQRKRRWLMSMYTAGLAKNNASEATPNPGHNNTNHNNIISTGPFPGSFHHHDGNACGLEEAGGGGGGALEDSDDALLVMWSEGLDFDRYVSEWRQTATSGPSEPWRNADGYAEAVKKATLEREAAAAAATTPTGNTCSMSFSRRWGRRRRQRHIDLGTNCGRIASPSTVVAAIAGVAGRGRVGGNRGGVDTTTAAAATTGTTAVGVADVDNDNSYIDLRHFGWGREGQAGGGKGYAYYHHDHRYRHGSDGVLADKWSDYDAGFSSSSNNTNNNHLVSSSGGGAFESTIFDQGSA